MKKSRFNIWLIAALISALPVLQACETSTGNYYFVGTGGFGLQTGLRSEADDSTWYFHHHEDLPEIACADLAAGPDGKLQYLAFLHEGFPGNWLLTIRRGLGAEIWSTSYSGIAVPEIDQSSACVSPRITHLRDGLFAIAWVVEGSLHTALFDSTKTPPEDLVLTDTLPPSAFGATTARGISIVYLDNRPWLVFSARSPSRILVKLGTLDENVLRFNAASFFFSHRHNSSSDALVHDDAIYVATTDDDTVYLHKRPRTSTAFEEVATCPGGDRIYNRLLYVDANGDMRVLRHNNSDLTSYLQNFTDCSTEVLTVATFEGHITYFPLR